MLLLLTTDLLSSELLYLGVHLTIGWVLPLLSNYSIIQATEELIS